MLSVNSGHMKQHAALGFGQDDRRTSRQSVQLTHCVALDAESSHWSCNRSACCGKITYDPTACPRMRDRLQTTYRGSETE